MPHILPFASRDLIYPSLPPGQEVKQELMEMQSSAEISQIQPLL